MQDEPAVAAPRPNVAGRIPAWTQWLVAFAALLTAAVGVIKGGELVLCQVGVSNPACPQKDADPTFSEKGTKVDTSVKNQNNQYSIYLFYTEARATEAKAVADGLSATGFQITKVLSTLEETGLKLAAGTTFILPSTSDKGDEIRFKVGEIVQKSLPNSRRAAVTLGGAYAIKSGDIQVQLY
jgi:hypothetical protein